MPVYDVTRAPFHNSRQRTDIQFDEGLCPYCFHAPCDKDPLGRRVNETETNMKTITGMEDDDDELPDHLKISKNVACCVDQMLYQTMRTDPLWRNRPVAETDPDILRQTRREQGVPPLNSSDEFVRCNNEYLGRDPTDPFCDEDLWRKCMAEPLKLVKEDYEDPITGDVRLTYERYTFQQLLDMSTGIPLPRPGGPISEQEPHA